MSGVMKGQSYVGTNLSLITNADIRYEGTLIDINTERKTISLSSVVCKGTEDRPAERKIPPSEHVFQYVIFRANDIVHLEIVNGNPELHDSAVLAVDVHPDQLPGSMNKPRPNNRPTSNRNGGLSLLYSAKPQIDATMSAADVATITNSEFDFTTNNSRFDKAEIAQELSNELAAAKKNAQAISPSLTIKSGYNSAKSFYDDISTGPSFWSSKNRQQQAWTRRN